MYIHVGGGKAVPWFERIFTFLAFWEDLGIFFSFWRLRLWQGAGDPLNEQKLSKPSNIDRRRPFLGPKKIPVQRLRFEFFESRFSNMSFHSKIGKVGLLHRSLLPTIRKDFGVVFSCTHYCVMPAHFFRLRYWLTPFFLESQPLNFSWRCWVPLPCCWSEGALFCFLTVR